MIFFHRYPIPLRSLKMILLTDIDLYRHSFQLAPEDGNSSLPLRCVSNSSRIYLAFFVDSDVRQRNISYLKAQCHTWLKQTMRDRHGF